MKRKELNHVKPYRELTFSDNFMFCEILRNNPELCKEIIEAILGIKIRKIVKIGTEESIKLSLGGKGIRLDVYFEGDDAIYNIELQIRNTGNIPKRSRFYQGVIDTDNLKIGEDYENLKKSFVIFICNFDLFGKGFFKYTFSNRCHEDTSIELGDEAYKVFVNTKGNLEDASPKMREFIEYLNDRTVSGELSEKIEKDLQYAVESEEGRSRYMTLEWELARVRREAKEEARKEALEEGLEKGREEGMRIGEEKGKKDGIIASILKLLNKFSAEEIISMGFSPEDVAQAVEAL